MRLFRCLIASITVLCASSSLVGLYDVVTESAPAPDNYMDDVAIESAPALDNYIYLLPDELILEILRLSFKSVIQVINISRHVSLRIKDISDKLAAQKFQHHVHVHSSSSSFWVPKNYEPLLKYLKTGDGWAQNLNNMERTAYMEKITLQHEARNRIYRFYCEKRCYWMMVQPFVLAGLFLSFAFLLPFLIVYSIDKQYLEIDASIFYVLLLVEILLCVLGLKRGFLNRARIDYLE